METHVGLAVDEPGMRFGSRRCPAAHGLAVLRNCTMDADYSDDLPRRPSGEQYRRLQGREVPLDLLLILARSNAEREARAASTRKLRALVRVAMLAAAVVAATFFWLARGNLATSAGEQSHVRLPPARTAEVAATELDAPRSEAETELTPADKGATPHPQALSVPDSVIQLGAYQSRAQAERAWQSLSARFPSVSAMGKLILPFPGGIRVRAKASSAEQAK